MSIDRRIDKEDVVYIYIYIYIYIHTHTMEYYSTIKKNEMPFAEMWMDLETVIQSEVKSEREKQISYINAYMWNLEKRYR